MQVCVIGTGYVGLVTGVCLAHVGHHVTCIDNNEAKVRLMQAGQSPIYEPGLAEMMRSAMQSQRLGFTTDLGAGVAQAEIVFIAVGTPSLPTGESDMQYVEAVARGIGRHLNSYKVIVNKSTVPVGSGDWVRRIILDGLAERPEAPEVTFDVVSNPEFLREGSAVYDTFNPDRIVLGSHSDRAIALMKELYAPIVTRQFIDTQFADAQFADAPVVALSAHAAATPEQPPVPVVVTDLGSAEMIKYAANAFLATKISFINEIANVCDRVGADVTQVAKGIGLDSRIGEKFLQAGIGWGGSCFPKDVAALVHTAHDYGYEPELLQAAVQVNRRQRLLAIEKLQQVLKVLKGKTIGLLGLTFKPDTDDLRDTPAIDLIAALERLGAKVKAYDPIYADGTRPNAISPSIAITTSPEELAVGCDALVLVTDWQQLRQLDYVQLMPLMATPILVDGRNCLAGQALAEAGFYYIGIGCPDRVSPTAVQHTIQPVYPLPSQRMQPVASDREGVIVSTSKTQVA